MKQEMDLLFFRDAVILALDTPLTEFTVWHHSDLLIMVILWSVSAHQLEISTWLKKDVVLVEVSLQFGINQVAVLIPTIRCII